MKSLDEIVDIYRSVVTIEMVQAYSYTYVYLDYIRVAALFKVVNKLNEIRIKMLEIPNIKTSVTITGYKY